MTPLFPDLKEQFEAAAAERATPRLVAAWRRRPWRFAAITLVGLAATTSAGYASRGLWLPVLGADDTGAKVAVRAAPSSETLGALAPLRRPQTDADRGSASQYALTFPAAQRGVRTAYVRRLGTSPDGQAIVLVPTTDRVGAAGGASSSGDALCLWVQDRAAGGQRMCGTLADLRAGKLTLRYGAVPDGASEQELARRRAESGGGSGVHHVGEGAGTDHLLVVGLAPDGAARVRLASRSADVTVAVTGSVFRTELSGAQSRFRTVTFLAADGSPLPR